MVPVIREPSCFKLKYALRTYPSPAGSATTQLPFRSAAAQTAAQTSNQTIATLGLMLYLQLEDSFHQEPFLTWLGSRQWLLKVPHQPLPFLHSWILEIGLRFRC